MVFADFYMVVLSLGAVLVEVRTMIEGLGAGRRSADGRIFAFSASGKNPSTCADTV